MVNKARNILFIGCIVCVSLYSLIFAGCNSYAPFIVKDSLHNKEYVIKVSREKYEYTSRVFCGKKLVHTLKGKVENAAISSNNQYLAIVIEESPRSIMNPIRVFIVQTDDMAIKYRQQIGTKLMEPMIGKQWVYWPSVEAMAIDNSGKNVILFWSGQSKQEGHSGIDAISRWNVTTQQAGPETVIYTQGELPIATGYSDIKMSDKTGDVTFKTTFYAKDPKITLPPSYVSQWNILTGNITKKP